MKRAKLLISIFIIVALTTFCSFACKEKNPDPAQQIDAVTITADEDGISFSHAEYSYFYYTLDGGEAEGIESGFTIDLSEELGEHTVKVYVLDDSDTKIALSEYKYTTVRLTLSDLSVAGRTVSWVAAAKKVSVKERGDFVPTSESSYTAQTDNVTVQVKAEGGFDAVSKIYYVGNTITKKGVVLPDSAEVLPSPELTVLDKTVTWNRALKASDYAVSYDGGDFALSSSAELSDALGKHTIRVKAVGDGARYADSVPTTLEYETLRDTLRLTKTASDRVTLASATECVFSADGEEFLPLPSREYIAEEGCTISFRAVGGYDRASHKNYLESEISTMKFIAPAARELLVVGGAEQPDLSLWAADKYQDSGWKSADAQISASNLYDGSSAISIHAWNNSVAYRFSTSVSLSDGYDVISFYYFGDGVSRVYFTLADEDSGYYIRRDLGVLPAYWQKITLRIDDDGWQVNGNNSLSLSSLWAMRRSEQAKSFHVPQEIADAFSLYELIPFLDRVSFTILGNTPNGAATTHSFASLLFDFSPETEFGVYQPLFDGGSAYVAYERLADDTLNELLLFLDEQEFRLYSTALEENFILSGSYEMKDKEGTLRLMDASTDFALTLAFEENGRSISVTEGEGALAPHFAACGAFRKSADLLLDFEDGESGESYVSEEWTAYTYATNDGWQKLTTPQMNARTRNGTSVVNFATGRYLTNRFVYHETGNPIGLANYFAIELGNYFENAEPVGVKLVAVDIYGDRYYLMGSESAFYSYPVTDNLVLSEINLPEAISLASVEVITKNLGEQSAVYLYADNLIVKYKADPSVFSGYPAPQIEAGEHALLFTYDEEDALFEYSVNNGEWTAGSNYFIPAEAGNYTVRVRGLIGAAGAYTKIASYTFTVEDVALSAISVSIDEEGQTASWTTNGITSIKVDRKDDSGIEEGEYVRVNENSYFTDKNIILNVRAEGYFDADAHRYYVGSQEISKKILVDVVLNEPVISPTSEGVAWAEVEDANAYAVSVNGGDYVTRTDLIFPFATNEGTYTLRVMSVMLDEQGEISAYSKYSEYTYRVRNVTLSSLRVDKATVSWTAEAYKVYIKVNNGEYTETNLSYYTAEALGGHKVTVKATAGFNLTENIYYYTEKDLTKDEEIVVLNLPTPTLLVNGAENGLYWAFVDEESGSITSVSDMQAVYPFATYMLSVNGGDWFAASDYLFPQAEGSYSVRVKAIGNGANYKDSEASVAYVFEVKAIRLSEIEILEQSELRTIASYDYVGLGLSRKVDDGAYVDTTETVFEARSTVNLSVKVEGGYDEGNAIYYAGESIEKTKRVIVPIYLDSPILSHSRDGITWSSVKNADAYSVSVNGGEAEIITDTALSYSAQFGVYHLVIKAINRKAPLQYPDSDAAEITYEIAEVSLSDLGIDGSVVSWTYRGFLSLQIVQDGESPTSDAWASYAKSEYANESGDDVTVYVRAEAGYDHENIVIYKGKAVEKNLPVKYSQLLSPVPTVNQGENGLVWEPISKASGYAYKLLSGDLSEEAVAAESESSEDWIATAGAAYAFTDIEGDYRLLLKAVGNGSTIADSAPVSLLYGVRAVSLSNFAVNKGVATWEKSGITSMQTIVMTGGMPEYGAYEPISVSTYAPEATLTINLRCAGGYDATESIYYIGETVELKNLEIIVPIYLAVPEVSLTEDGIALESVRNADSYQIKVNDGEYEYFAGTVLPYRESEGDYQIKIRAYNQAQPAQYPESDDAVISYAVRRVSLSDITDDSGVARFNAVGLLSVKEEGGEYISLSGSSYSPAATTTVFVRAAIGVDLINATVYIGTTAEKSKKIIVPIPLSTPLLSLGSEQITIGAVINASSYFVQADNGAWTEQTGLTIAYQTALGSHTLRVKAHATDSVQYPDGNFAEVTYTTAALALSDISLSGATFSWSASAYSVRMKINSGSYTNTNETSYTATTSGTTTLSLRAYRGYHSARNTYYYDASSYFEKSKSVTITKLSAPSLSVSNGRISWSAISGATAYAVKVNNGSYANQSSTQKALSTQEGSYKVYVRAVGDGKTILNSDESTYEYTVKTVTLSNLSVVGAKASWTAVAYKTSLSVNGASYSQTTATSYTPASEGTYTVKVKAEGGWDSSKKIYYYTASAIEKSATVKLYKLAKPALTTNSKGVTWAAVSNATSYSVKVDNDSYKTQSDRSVAFSTAAGTHTVYVKAIGASSSGYQDSDAATYTYETKQTALTFLTSSSTMTTWIYTGLKAQYSTDGSTYKDTLYCGYTATASGTVKFRAVGGWDASANIYYNGTTSAQSKSFTLPGLAIGSNFESGVSGWTKEYYDGNTSSWKNTTATSVTSVSDAYGAGSAIKLQSYLNGNAYRFGYSFGDMPASYKSLSFDVRLNAYATDGTSLRFQDSASGTYVDYNLGHLSLSPAVWYHVTVGFEDSNLIINSGGKEYTAPKAKSLLGSSSFYDKIKALDKMYVTVKGSNSNGPAVYTYIDNFQFSTATCGSATKSRITTKELSFDDGTTGSAYTNSSWKQYQYGSGTYQSTTGKIQVIGSEKRLSLYSGYNTYKITYNEGGSSLGTMNHFAIDLGGDSGTTVSYRIELLTTSGSTIYVAGGASYSALLGNTAGASNLTTLNFNFAATAIKTITIYASTSGDGHLFMDNIILSKLS